jgi:hypothetical protein
VIAQLEQVAVEAEQLASSLALDVQLARDRESHIRATARATEAARLSSMAAEGLRAALSALDSAGPGIRPQTAG